jgi:DNA primase
VIPRSKIDEIISAARIDEVVADYVSLKKRGASLQGLCPFHNEKTPSFNVSPARGIFKCFGCGKAGNSVTFIMEYEHLDYISALRHLAEKYHIEWPEQAVTSEEIEAEKKKAGEKESLQIINNFAENYFIRMLNDDEEGRNIGLSYFEEREFRPETITRFRLGYSKDAWDHFTGTAIKGGFNPELLKRSGLVKAKQNENDPDAPERIYDAYRGRVIFPIHALNGKPIAFAGRHLIKDPKSPKYVNSPETELYHKSNELYGLYFARQAISKLGYVNLVEGYTDVISMFQAGVENVVASSGTSLTENQIKLIRRFTENVCVLYDGDAAGIKASLRGIDMLLEGGLNVKVLLFPDGEDPDSYCRKFGAAAFQEFLEANRKDFILFKTSLLLQDAGNDPIRKAELTRDIVGSISKIPDAIKRAGFVSETAKVLQVDEQLLHNEINKLLRAASPYAKAGLREESTEPQQPQPQIVPDDNHHQERDIVRLILLYGLREYEGYQNAAHYIMSELHAHEIEIEDPLLMEFFSEVNSMLIAENPADPDHFVNHPNPMISALAATIIAEKHELSPHWERKLDVIIDAEGTNYKDDIESALVRLRLKHLNTLLTRNQEELSKVTSDEEITLHQQVHQHLMEERLKLSARTGTVIVR